MEGQIVTKVVRRLEEVEGIAEVWRSWQCHPNSDLDYYLTILCSRPEILRPHILVLCRDGHPEAMLIGRLDKRRVELRVGYKTLLTVGARSLTFIYGGGLGDHSPENSIIFVREVVKSLRLGEADMAYFSHLKVGSPTYESIQSMAGFLTREHFLASGVHRSMALPASAEEFQRRLPSKARQKQRKLLGALGDSLRVVCYRTAEELETVCRDVETIARKTYQRGLGVGFVDNDEIRQRMHLAAARGWLRAYLLYFGTRPAAFWIGTVYGEKFHSDYMGYDPELAERSPGIFLVTKAIEEICDRQREWGTLEIDWGFGDAQYKEMLGTCEWKEASVHIFAPSIRGVALNAVRTPGALVEHVSKDLLGKWSVVSWVKKRWRQRLARA